MLWIGRGSNIVIILEIHVTLICSIFLMGLLRPLKGYIRTSIAYVNFWRIILVHFQRKILPGRRPTNFHVIPTYTRTSERIHIGFYMRTTYHNVLSVVYRLVCQAMLWNFWMWSVRWLSGIPLYVIVISFTLLIFSLLRCKFLWCL